MIQTVRLLLVALLATPAACGSGRAPKPSAVPIAPAEVPRALPPEPYPEPIGIYSVAEMRVRGDERLELEIVLEGYVTWIYDCVEDLEAKNGWTRTEVHEELEENPQLCRRPAFYLGETPDTPKARSFWVVEVPRPMTQVERANLPQEVIDTWPTVPEVAVGDFVAVQGTWRFESTHGEINTSGLLQYSRMAKSGDQNRVAAETQTASLPPGSGWWCHSYRTEKRRGDESFCTRTQKACVTHADLLASGKLGAMYAGFESIADCASAKEAWAVWTGGLMSREFLIVSSREECKRTKFADTCGRVF